MLKNNALKNALVLRETNEKQKLEEALLKMASVLTNHEEDAVTSSGHLLFDACQLLGQKMGIHFFMPKGALSTDRSKLISEISESSQVRFRKISLTGQWWKNAAIPLIAFLGPEKIPVALIAEDDEYFIYNPMFAATHPYHKQLLSIEIAKEMAALSPEAYTFYEGLPPQADDPHEREKSITFFSIKGKHKDITIMLLVGILGALLSLFQPFASNLLYSVAIPEINADYVWQIGFGLLISTVSISLFMYVRTMLTTRLMSHAERRLETGFWDRLLNLPPSFFSKFAAGNLYQKMSSIDFIRQLVAGNAIRATLSGIFALFYLLSMIAYNSHLTLICLIPTVIMLVVTYFASKAKYRYMNKVVSSSNSINGKIVEFITGIAKIRIAGAEKRAFTKWAHGYAEQMNQLLKSRSVDALITVCQAVLTPLTSCMLFIACFSMIDSSEGASFNLAHFIAFYFAFLPFQFAIYDLAQTALVLAPVGPMWQMAQVVFQSKPESNPSLPKADALKGEIHIDNVHFSYPDQSTEILKGCSLMIKPKSMTALVGVSGSGKSTLVRLMLGFETPTQGTIYYDRRDIASIDIRSIRRQIGTVLQTSAILSGTIRDNILCGRNFSQDEVMIAIEKSGFDQDLKNFPMGIHTLVPAGGGTISGGQRQRLLLARALLGNPSILILDEATSALDNQSQHDVLEKLEQLDVTRFVIAHRLSTLRKADNIYILEQGKVVQEGTFEELAKSKGLFQSLLKRQTL